jgi:threonine dehydrogenase-like Zn-dependent dehydrogenase
MSQVLLDQPTTKTATTMRAAVLVAPGTMEVREVALPLPRGNEIRVKVQGCGVCASNIPPWEGREWFKYPMKPGQLGHEGWGIVDKVGSDVRNVSVGERVAFLGEHSYAEYDVAAAGSFVALPASLADKPFPAEPLGCAMNIFRRSGIKAGDTVAIVGIGFLGALLTKLASDAGARVLAISRRPWSLDLARKMGAAQAIPMDPPASGYPGKIIEIVRQASRNTFCDVVVEAVGKQWPLDLAAEITRERGRLVVAGYHQDGPRQVNMQLWNWRGLDVINAHERDPRIYLQGMQEAVDLVASGAFDPTPLYTHTFPLERLGDALNMTRDRPDGFLKALIPM